MTPLSPFRRTPSPFASSTTAPLGFEIPGLVLSTGRQHGATTMGYDGRHWVGETRRTWELSYRPSSAPVAESVLLIEGHLARLGFERVGISEERGTCWERDGWVAWVRGLDVSYAPADPVPA